MANGMANWAEWKGLTQDQRDYEQYKILIELSQREYKRNDLCSARLITCTEHFDKLDKRKWFDRGAALAGGFASGILGALGIKWGGQ